MSEVFEEALDLVSQAQLDVDSGIGLCNHVIAGGMSEDRDTVISLAWAVLAALSRAHESMDSIRGDLAAVQDAQKPARKPDEPANPEKAEDPTIHRPPATRKEAAKPARLPDAVDVLRRVYLTIGPMQLHGNLLFHGALNWEANESPQIDHQALMGMGKHLMSAYDTIGWALEDFARLLGVDDYQGKIEELVQMVREGEA